jgi:hypothetical protein
VNGECATITPTPTSQRPFGAALSLVSDSPNPAISGRTKTWVFQIENPGGTHGCEAHTVDFFATLGGLLETQISESRMLGCNETALIVVASTVTSPAGGTIDIDARATAGASPVNGQFSEVEDVIPVGSFDCDDDVDSIDAALVLQLTAALIQPFDCTGAGDVNDDGFTNAIDASLVLQYVAGLIEGLATDSGGPSGSPLPTTTQTPLAGDVDCNRLINAIDAALILQYHARLVRSLECIASADINEDGRINSVDALLLIQFVVVPCFPSVPC